ELTKFRRSNQNTLINQRPIVRIGDKVKRGEPIADSSATKNGELALGKNLLVAFLPYFGYNYEDAIVVSENVLKEDIFTSIHIIEYEVAVRETKLGPEEVTRDLPNVSEEALKNLDENGIVRIGAEVKPDDILVGKVSPKGERELTPEERLILAIFGEKAKDVRDTSKRVPPGVQGVVVDVMVLSRRKDDPLSKKVMRQRRERIKREAAIERKVILMKLKEAAKRLLTDVVTQKNIHDEDGRIVLRAGEKFTPEFFDKHGVLSLDFPEGFVESEEIEDKFRKLLMDVQRSLEHVEERMKRAINQLERGDELPPGVLQLIKVYIAQKRKLQVGDKLSGRHGNKGVIAKIAPVEDMPFLDDGTPVDIVLNPLGVPSRMNIGQILETVLGWAAVELRNKLRKMLDSGAKPREIRKFLLELYPESDYNRIKRMRSDDIMKLARKLADEGVYFTSPVFEGFKIEDIEKRLELAGLPKTGKARLRDGRTGEYFDEEATVGYIYMMKLIHMVEDKIHARATGPYSLITQQPVGGKSHFGGQRFGEMEVWALEAHGAAHTLQEMLTVKSDDIKGRNLLYQAIIRGEEPPEPGMPASFDVLVKELQGLCLDVEIETEEEKKRK
ncbi:MAG: DNA-directed RNA polymerase subunit beta, partial [Candidatus Hydrothermota bacterium]